MRRYTLTVGGKRFEIDVDELGADSFRVLLDGHAYEVTLEAAEELIRPALTPMVKGFSDYAQAPALPSVAAAAPALPTTPRPSPAPAAPRPAAAGRGVLSAPMPGTILSVQVSPGQPVRRGDPLIVLEAMKMQNIIKAPEDALVAEVLVRTGQSVGFGEPMVRFDPGML